MTRRLPAHAPGPPGPADPGRPPPDDDEPDPATDPGDWAETPDDADLLDSGAWPDDLDEPTVPDGWLDNEPDLEDLAPLDGIGDDGVEEDVELPADDAPLEDDLTDLDAPDDTEMPILPWSLTILLDRRRIDATVDPSLPQTTWWVRGSGEPSTRRVVLEIAGRTLTVEVARLAADRPEGIVLGRDVLVGRFLLRP